MSHPLDDIPPEELQTWEDELVLAEELAAAHQPYAGYQLLDAALAVVEAMPATDWQPHLVGLYRSALVLFCLAHDIAQPAGGFTGAPGGEAHASTPPQTATLCNAPTPGAAPAPPAPAPPPSPPPTPEAPPPAAAP